MSTADEPVYIPGIIYTINERDWLLSRGAIEENVDTDAMPHLLEIYVDYSMVEESADNSGVFEFFLACLITHFEKWKRIHYSNANSTQAPRILVDVMLSPCAILLGGKSVDVVQRATEVVAEFCHNPYVPEGKLVSQDFFRGSGWHNDSVLRMGTGSIAVRPLMITHDPAVLEMKMKALAEELSPFRSERTHLFVTNTPALIGTVFTEAPIPMSEESFLRQTDRSSPAYPERGSLETDDLTPVLSAAAPLSANAFMAYGIITGYLRAHTEKIVGERAGLFYTQALWNDHIILFYAGQGRWTEKDAHDIVCVLLGAENSLDSLGLEAELTDDKLQEILIDNELDEGWQIQLWLRRIESSGISKEGVREAIATFLSSMHIPSCIATGPLVDIFPPLLPPRGLRLAYARGEDQAYPPPLKADDLNRQFLEPMGKQFWTGLLFDDSKTVQGAPQRLTINDMEIVAEWFIDETPDSALIRRQCVAWEDVKAWVMYEESTVLVDRAGRFFEVIPQIFLEYTELKTLLEEKKRQCVDGGALVQNLSAKRYRAHITRLIQAREFGVAENAVVDAPWESGPQKKDAQRPVRVSTKSSHMRSNGPKERVRHIDKQGHTEKQSTFKKGTMYVYAAVGALIVVTAFRLLQSVLIYLEGM